MSNRGRKSDKQMKYYINITMVKKYGGVLVFSVYYNILY